MASESYFLFFLLFPGYYLSPRCVVAVVAVVAGVIPSARGVWQFMGGVCEKRRERERERKEGGNPPPRVDEFSLN
jgi:hypothetical protein